MVSLKVGEAARPVAARVGVAAIFCLNGLALANWIARIPDAKARLSLSDGTLGFVLLFAAIGALIGQPTTGWLIGRFGSRRVTITLGLVFALTVALLGMASTVPQLMAALLVMGIFNGGLDVAMNAQAAQVEKAYGQPIMASFHGIWSVGGLAGAALGGVVAAQGVALGTHMLMVAGLTFVGLMLTTHALVPDAGSGTGEGGPSFALPPPALLLLGAVAFGVLFCEGAIADWGAVYLREGLGSPPGLAATGFAVFSLLMAAGRLSGDWLTLKLGAGRIARGGGALVALGVALAMATGEPLAAIAGFGLIGAGVSCIFPLILSAAARTPGIAPGTAIAAMATCGYTGFLVGPPLIGSLAEALSLRGALGVLGVLGVLILAFGGAVKPKHD
ncbi:MAG TPA: MFS transporter [Roseiflexaceae bacterium]|nr:MFS transporter [Roseiflexaceae bacterium]